MQQPRFRTLALLVTLLTFALVQRFVDRMITVEDKDIIAAVLWIFTNARLVAEPSGAATTAAALSGALDAAIRVEGPIVAIVSGGNMGVEKLAEWSRAVP